MGNPELVKRHWVKPGAVVLDVGINVVEGQDGESRVVGDVAFEEVSQVAGRPSNLCPATHIALVALSSLLHYQDQVPLEGSTACSPP